MMRLKAPVLDILRTDRETILSDWIAWVRLDPPYAVLPHERLVEGVTLAYDAFAVYIEQGTDDAIIDCVAHVAEKRFAARFPLNSSLRALEGFRRTLEPYLLKNFSLDDFSATHQLVMDAVNRAQKAHIDIYQQLSQEQNAALLGRYEMTMEELTHERDRAWQAMALKEHFLANIRHELKTPLTIIQGFSSLIRSGVAPPGKVEELAGKIYEAGGSLLRMVDEIILLSRLESGEEQCAQHPLYLHDLVTDVMSTLCMEEDAGRRHWVFDDSAPNPMVVGDIAKLKVMLAHLFENAVKFSEEDTTIFVKLREGGGLAIIDIKDEGIGINRADADLIFEKFRQKRGDMAREFEGTGLGLPLARLIARLHKGDVTLMCDVKERGSVFRVMLPTATP